MADEDIAELQANLEEYREQLQQLEELLLDEPDNEDYQGLYAGVQEAISLTEQTLAHHTAATAAGTSGTATAPAVGRKRRSRFDTGVELPVEPQALDAEAAGGVGALPKQVLDQIRQAKARSALEGRAPAGWAIGSECLARCATGQWAEARVVAVTSTGDYKVEWDGGAGASAETVHKADCRPRDSSNYKGVNAPTRKAVNEVSKDAYERYLKGDLTAIPKWMQIQDTDGPKQREKKQRAIKAFKKKLRFEKKDLASTKQANDWKSFIGNKGSKKKTGFMTGTKKQSMFAVPDNPDSKVGVVGSGRGMTGATTKRTRLDF